MRTVGCRKNGAADGTGCSNSMRAATVKRPIAGRENGAASKRLPGLASYGAGQRTRLSVTALIPSLSRRNLAAKLCCLIYFDD